MAEVPFQYGICIGRQTTPGTPEPDILAIVGTADESQGAILGAPDEGAGGSGITARYARNAIDVGNIPGSFTPAPSNFGGVTVETLDVAIQLAGSGANAPSVDADYQPVRGVDALLFAAGLEGAADTGNGWLYTVDSDIVPIVTVNHFGPGWNVITYDAAASVSIDFTPGQIAVATFSLAGSFFQQAVQSFPDFDVTQQLGRAAPVVREAQHNWGMGGVLRGFSEGTLTIDSSIEEFGDSNATTGLRNRKTARTITFESTIYSDDANVAYELQAIALETPPTDPLTFTIGDPTADPAEAYKVTMTNPECEVTEPTEVGGTFASTVTLKAVSTSKDQEFTLAFPSS